MREAKAQLLPTATDEISKWLTYNDETNEYFRLLGDNKNWMMNFTALNNLFCGFDFFQTIVSQELAFVAEVSANNAFIADGRAPSIADTITIKLS